MSQGKRVRLLVHVGEGKTGSSAIQRMLYVNKDALAGAGIRYLGLMLDKATERRFPWQDVSSIEQFHRLPPDQAVEELGQVLSAAVDAAARDGIHTLVWSNESLCSRSATTIRALRGLDGTRVELAIVAYLRRPDRWAQSAYLQWGIKHKTYPGPLQDFATWIGRQRLQLAPRVRAWRDAFGRRVSVRNYDAIDDVTRDFAGLLGVDAAGLVVERRNLPLAPAELALRALFNQRAPGNMRPHRFNDLFDSESVDFDLPLQAWLRGLLPTEAQLRAIKDAGAEDRRQINAMFAASDQPPFDDAPASARPFSLDTDTVAAALMQMLAVQAERIERLEQQVAALGKGPSATPGKEAPPAGPKDGEAPTPQVMRALAPSLGYFGALPSDCLEVRLPVPVAALRLSLDEPRPGFLNLRGLQFVKDGTPLSPPAARARQSSTTGGDPENGAANLLALKGIHSGAERAPWWEASFDPPVQADALRVTNRGDVWGSRSRTLRIEATAPDGTVHRVHDGQSEALLRESLAEAARVAGMAPVGSWPRNVGAARRLRDALLSGIAGGLRSGSLALDGPRWPLVVPFLDMSGGQEAPTADAWTVIAGFLLAQAQEKRGTSVKAFAHLLDRRQRLLRLQSEVNTLAVERGLGRLMLTRHGLKAEGALRRDPERFVAHMRAVVEALQALGREPVLAYGTLLGAVRDGEFIAHDDDVDLMARSRAGSRAEVEADVLALKADLEARGFRVEDLLPHSLNLHVIDRRSGTSMDVFPCWEEGGLLQMHMESLKVRGIDPSIMYPPSTIAFRGGTFPAPARPEAFLAERYGDGWATPDPFYEWPWPLKEEAAA